MNSVRVSPPSAQLSMPGIPTPERQHLVTNCYNIAPGQEVLYLGKISGGPHYRSRGVVKQALQRKAVVDMGRLGTWHIPYYFLTVPQAA